MIKRLFFVLGLLNFITLPALAQHFPQPQNTDRNMSIVVLRTTIGEEGPQPGDEIGLFDPDGVCAGWWMWPPNEEPDEPVGIVAWGDDPNENGDQGFENGDPLNFIIWDSNENMELSAEFIIEMGEEVYQENGLLICSLHAEPPEPPPQGHFPIPVITDDNMCILSMETSIGGELCENGDEVAAFDPDGVCAGLWIFQEGGEPGVAGIALWRDDPSTDVDEGFEAGDLPVFRIWDASHEMELITEVEVVEGDIVWESNGFAVVNLRAEGEARAEIAEPTCDFGVLDMVSHRGETFTWETSLVNTGNAVLTFASVESEGDVEQFHFAIDDEVVRPGAHTTIHFEYPLGGYRLGTSIALLVNMQFDPGEDEAALHVYGRIGAPEYAVDRDAIEFGIEVIDSSMHGPATTGLDSVQVFNHGDATMLVTGICCTDPAFYLPGGDPTELTIPPNESAWIRVIFDPDREECDGLLTFATNAITDPTNPIIRLHGTGAILINVRDDETSSPIRFGLSPLYPNPFNGTAALRFTLPTAGQVRLAVYDIRGTELLVPADGWFEMGEHSINISSEALPAGAYIARLRAGPSSSEVRFSVVK